MVSSDYKGVPKTCDEVVNNNLMSGFMHLQCKSHSGLKECIKPRDEESAIDRFPVYSEMNVTHKT